MDARGRKGAWEALVYYVHPEKTARDRAHRRARAVVRGSDALGPAVPQAAGDGRHGPRDRSRHRNRRLGAGDADRRSTCRTTRTSARRTAASRCRSRTSLEAYEKSTPRSFRAEFGWDEEECERAERWGAFASELTTNLHEVIGHGSGLVSESLKGDAGDGARGAVLGDRGGARRSRGALLHRRSVHGGVRRSCAAADHDDVVRAEYEAYASNALVQLRRMREGTQIEEDHMRNRQLIVHWLLAHTDAIEVAKRDGKTYYRVGDCRAFREGVGALLAEVQRIKAEGDYQAARALVETYGVHFDPELRDEVVARVERSTCRPTPPSSCRGSSRCTTSSGTIIDVAICYPHDFTAQMLEYADATRTERETMLRAIARSSARSARRRAAGGLADLPCLIFHSSFFISREFSCRLPRDLDPNPLTRAVAELRARGVPLRRSHGVEPDRARLRLPAALLDAPRGPRAASLRSAAARPPGGARGCRRRLRPSRGSRAAPDRIVLTASSSESYSLLFKLLCDPGDSVLVPVPSYPLFEHLARLDAVRRGRTALEYHGAVDAARWRTCARVIDARTRAVLVVSPNNPTGSASSAPSCEASRALCAAHELALIGDEVFCRLPASSPVRRPSRSVLERGPTAHGLARRPVEVGWPAAAEARLDGARRPRTTLVRPRPAAAGAHRRHVPVGCNARAGGAPRVCSTIGAGGAPADRGSRLAELHRIAAHRRGRIRPAGSCRPRAAGRPWCRRPRSMPDEARAIALVRESGRARASRVLLRLPARRLLRREPPGRARGVPRRRAAHVRTPWHAADPTDDSHHAHRPRPPASCCRSSRCRPREAGGSARSAISRRWRAGCARRASACCSCCRSTRWPPGRRRRTPRSARWRSIRSTSACTRARLRASFGGESQPRPRRPGGPPGGARAARVDYATRAAGQGACAAAGVQLFLGHRVDARHRARGLVRGVLLVGGMVARRLRALPRPARAQRRPLVDRVGRRRCGAATPPRSRPRARSSRPRSSSTSTCSGSPTSSGRTRARRLATVALFGDFPFMVATDSADVWARQHLFRFDRTVGVPPDAFSATGQDWGLPVYRWDVDGSRRLPLAAPAREAQRAAVRRVPDRPPRRASTARSRGRSAAKKGSFEPADRGRPARARRAPDGALHRAAERDVIAEDLGVVPDFVRESLDEPRASPDTRSSAGSATGICRGEPFRDPAGIPRAVGRHDGHARHRPDCPLVGQPRRRTNERPS